MLRSLVPSSRLIRLVAMFSVSNIFMRNGELGLRIDHRRQFIDDLVQGERVSIGHHNGQDEGRQDVVVAAIHCASLAGSIWKFQKTKYNTPELNLEYSIFVPVQIYDISADMTIGDYFECTYVHMYVLYVRICMHTACRVFPVELCSCWVRGNFNWKSVTCQLVTVHSVSSFVAAFDTHAVLHSWLRYINTPE